MEIMDVILMHDEAKQVIHEMLEKENKYEVGSKNYMRIQSLEFAWSLLEDEKQKLKSLLSATKINN
ncbi:hypothetical protein V8H04_11920 [Staphylococcus aureus]|uniref:Phage protein n=1 Tax=Staphylococcus aureus TaxID=1280 RepID=A0A811I871_STAAU|nr:phage protein [Staphylococcus aureus]HCX0790276.1 hypothetical protein [Staphylococcus aureus]HCX0790898.1 hypothetical protein [Staphylococcus aureus]HCX0798814.1 hypothetical protein [Staphylococcus aureus]HCX0799662.1 hypothetical protein [Staphylococcus aureus]